MAVAVKNIPDSSTRMALGGLISASVLGALYILGCAAVIFWGVPRVWDLGVVPYLARVPFVSVAILVVIEIVTIAILSILATALVGPTPPQGLRAGVFLVLVWLFLTGAITILAGRVFQHLLGGAPGIGLALTAAVAVGLLYWGWSLISRPKSPAALRGFEDQGWFSTQRLKPMQGQRVRRATMLGIILLIAAGIWALYAHGTLNTLDNTWAVNIPFTNYALPILPDVRFTVPLLLAAAGLWLAFRVVHLPVFADFLIATEAELNKVSWPTRKSVVQDTIVVLATVLMLTVFLFLVDLGWGTLLSWKPIGIIRQADTTKTPAQQTDTDKIPY